MFLPRRRNGSVLAGMDLPSNTRGNVLIFTFTIFVKPKHVSPPVSNRVLLLGTGRDVLSMLSIW